MTAELIVARARACLGARFRAWGRDPAFGLDCVGLAALALGLTAPAGYALRGGDPRRIDAMAVAAGLTAIAPQTARAGDLLLLSEGAGQLHLVILTGLGFVHADARIGRVVETPGAPEAARLRAWRREG
jgi:cell wall-associated NlpC family hydrolase